MNYCKYYLMDGNHNLTPYDIYEKKYMSQNLSQKFGKDDAECDSSNDFALPSYESCENPFPDILNTINVDNSDNSRAQANKTADSNPKKVGVSPRLLKHAKLETLHHENEAFAATKDYYYDSNYGDQLINSMENGDMEFIKWLLNGFADPNYMDPQTGHSLINLAIIFGGWNKQLELSKQQSSANENNTQTKKHITQLYKPTKTAVRNSLAIINILLRYGADINKLDKTGKTPLFIACDHELVTFVSFLVLNGANVNKPISNGTLPITIAAVTGNARIVLFLLEYGSKISKYAVEMSHIYGKHVIWNILQDRLNGRRVSAVNTTLPSHIAAPPPVSVLAKKEEFVLLKPTLKIPTKLDANLPDNSSVLNSANLPVTGGNNDNTRKKPYSNLPSIGIKGDVKSQQDTYPVNRFNLPYVPFSLSTASTPLNPNNSNLLADDDTLKVVDGPKFRFDNKVPLVPRRKYTKRKNKR